MGLVWAEWGRMGMDLQDPWGLGAGGTNKELEPEPEPERGTRNAVLILT
jgi:hypothetical protein